MKKMIWLVAVLLIAQTVAQAQTQVLSRNAVGYVKITAERNKLVLGRSDFEAMDGGGGIAVSNLFGNQLPDDSRVYLWDRTTATYKILQKTARGAWGPGGSNRVQRGDSFCIKVPASAASNSYDVYVMGEVPDRFTAPTTTVGGIVGMNMLGYPYPVSVSWTGTDLAAKAPVDSRLYLWDVSNQSYVIHQKTARGGWATAGGVLLTPGVGFWLKNTSSVNWVEVKPYTWP